MKLVKRILKVTKKKSVRKNPVKFVKSLLEPKRTIFGRKLTKNERFIKPILKKIDKKHRRNINRLVKKYQPRLTRQIQAGIKLVG